MLINHSIKCKFIPFNPYVVPESRIVCESDCHTKYEKHEYCVAAAEQQYHKNSCDIGCVNLAIYSFESSSGFIFFYRQRIIYTNEIDRPEESQQVTVIEARKRNQFN